MADIRSTRRDLTPPPRTRPRSRPDVEDDAPEPLEQNGGGSGRPDEAPRPRPQPAPRQDDEDDFQGFDEEINNRYEEIKKGGTHISELQAMTMPQLLKIAKDEGLTEYNGLKKQDLIFKI